MSLDLTKIINEALTEKIEEENEVMNEAITATDVGKTIDANKGKVAAGLGAATGAALAAGAMSGKGKEALAAAGEKIKDVASKAGEKVSDVTGKAGEKVSDVASKAGEKVSDVTGNAAAAIKNAKESIMNPELHKIRKGLDKTVANLDDVKPEDAQEAILRPGLHMAKKGLKALSDSQLESSAVAAAISAGLGAKTILEQIRRFKK